MWEVMRENRLLKNLRETHTLQNNPRADRRFMREQAFVIVLGAKFSKVASVKPGGE